MRETGNGLCILAALLVTAAAAQAAPALPPGYPRVLGMDGGPYARASYPVRVRKLQRVLWHFDAGVKMGDAVAGADGVVRVMGGGGHLHALDAKTGKQLWVASGNGGYWNYSTAVVGPDGTTYGGNYGFLSAITREGKRLWRADVNAHWIHRPPALSPDGKRLYFGSDNLGLVCLDAKTGAILWRHDDCKSPWSLYTFDERGRVVAGLPSGLTCFDKSGHIVWRLPERVSALTATPDTLFYARSAELHSVGGKELLPRFSLSFPAKVSGIALSGRGRILVTLDDGEAACVDAKGRIRWRRKISDKRLLPPAAAAEGESVVCDDEGKLFCLDSNGVVEDSFDTGGHPYGWRPVIGPDGNVYVSQAGSLLCVGGAAREESRPLLATSLVVVADDFVVDVWVNGKRLPKASRKLVDEKWGATTEKDSVDLRKGDSLVFNVVSNPLRWGGASYFAVQAIDPKGHLGFVSWPSGGWYACDDPSKVKAFVEKRDAGTDRPAALPARPWSDGPAQFRGRIPGNFTGAPVWGTSRNTWIKYIVGRRPKWKRLATGKMIVLDVERALYERAGATGFLTHFRVRNVCHRPVTLLLPEDGPSVYPDTWGACDGPERGMVDEPGLDPRNDPVPGTRGTPAQKRALRPGAATDLYVAFHGGPGSDRKAVEMAGGGYVCVCFLGKLDATDGKRTERLALWLGQDDSVRALFLKRPIVWKRAPPVKAPAH